MALGRAINAVQRFWSPDNESWYSHAGIILSHDQRTLEALWTIKVGHLNKYIGDDILVGRPVGMPSELKVSALSPVVRHLGRWYPFHRLLFHLLPPLAKYSPRGTPTCSELVGEYLSGLGIVDRWWGFNPDHIADMIRKWDAFDVVYEEKQQ
jgi:hypothetical protein